MSAKSGAADIYVRFRGFALPAELAANAGRCVLVALGVIAATAVGFSLLGAGLLALLRRR